MVKWLDHVGSITGANASCLKAWAHLGAYDACGGLLLIRFGAFFGHLWPNMAYQLYDLCGSMSVAARCSLNHLLPSYAAYARQIQRPVVLLLSSLFSTAGHCLRLRIPI